MWRVIKRAKMPVANEPVKLSRADGKQPDGATLILWSRGKRLAWDVTVPDAFSEFHLIDTTLLPGSNTQDYKNTCQ